jgi:hypothetical protein
MDLDPFSFLERDVIAFSSIRCCDIERVWHCKGIRFHPQDVIYPLAVWSPVYKEEFKCVGRIPSAWFVPIVTTPDYRVAFEFPVTHQEGVFSH